MAAQAAAPINPAVLRWALEEDGRPREELVERLRVDSSVVDAWLDGVSSPSRGQLTHLADVLRRPRALFFLPEPPEEASAAPRFRRPPGSSRETSAAGLTTIRRARRVQKAVAWARADMSPVSLPDARLEDSPEVAARRVRDWVGVTDTEQLAWRDDREALSSWRRALDERDVLVFQLEIGADEVRGFSAWDSKAPLIALNINRVTPAARMFTLGHELAHLALRLDAACVDLPEVSITRQTSDPERLERWCEAFAAAFLMPKPALTHLLRSRAVGQGAASLEDVKAVATHFRVSMRASALRIIELGWADKGLYGQVLAVFRPQAPKATSSDFRRPYRSTSRLREYGARTLETVLTTMPETDAMSVLRIDWQDVRRLADEVPGLVAS